MKTKLSVLLLFFCLNIFGQSVPNTTTFTLQNVVDVTGGTSLQEAFDLSIGNYFNPTYGSKTMSPQTLLGFRDYGRLYAYDDWYLPSITELAEMYSTIGPTGSHGFSSDYYWSSTQHGAEDYYARTFTDGSYTYLNIYVRDHVRAVRAYTSVTSYTVGGEGQAGGWVFYKSGNDYKEAAPSDQSTLAYWTTAVSLCNALIIYH